MNSPYHKTGETVISKVFCRDSTCYPNLISLQYCLNRDVGFYFPTYTISMCYINIGPQCKKKKNNFNNHFIFITPKGRLFLTSPRQVIEWLEWDIWYPDFHPYVYYQKKNPQITLVSTEKWNEPMHPMFYISVLHGFDHFNKNVGIGRRCWRGNILSFFGYGLVNQGRLSWLRLAE